MKPTVIVLALLIATGLAGAAPGAEGPGRPSYGGTGCPAGTAAAVLSGSTLTVRYSAFRVSAGGTTGKSFDRKACSLSVPVDVPPGRSVAVVSATYRGNARLPAGARAQFRAEYFYPGGTGPVATRVLTGPAEESFTFSSPAKTVAWSKCGADVILRTNASLRVSASGGKAASVSIRTQEVRNAVVYGLRWRDC